MNKCMAGWLDDWLVTWLVAWLGGLLHGWIGAWNVSTLFFFSAEWMGGWTDKRSLKLVLFQKSRERYTYVSSGESPSRVYICDFVL